MYCVTTYRPQIIGGLCNVVQGDQMYRDPFLSKLMRNLNRGKKYLAQICDCYFCNFLKSAQSKQLHNRTIWSPWLFDMKIRMTSQVLKGRYFAGLPDGIFSKPNSTILGKFSRTLEWEVLVYFMVIWIIFGPFGMFYGYLVML
jgi:hypothetical protein